MDVVLAAVVSTVVGGLSGWLTALLGHRRERRAQRGDDGAGSVRQAFDRLAALRSIYQQVATARRRGPYTKKMEQLENAFVTTCDASADEKMAAAARAYVGVGRLYAGGDEDTGTSHEENAYDTLSAAMRLAVRDLQSP